MARQLKLPKDFPTEWAREGYIYQAVGRKPASIFYREFEDRRKAGREVEFRFHDVVMFFAQAAAAGIIGNFSYAAILQAIKAIRKPKQEIGGKDIRFGTVVSRKTYNRVRRERHVKKRGRTVSTSELEERIETEYRLMVHLKLGAPGSA